MGPSLRAISSLLWGRELGLHSLSGLDSTSVVTSMLSLDTSVGRSSREETPGQTQNTAERLHLLCGLGTLFLSMLSAWCQCKLSLKRKIMKSILSDIKKQTVTLRPNINFLVLNLFLLFYCCAVYKMEEKPVCSTWTELCRVSSCGKMKWGVFTAGCSLREHMLEMVSVTANKPYARTYGQMWPVRESHPHTEAGISRLQSLCQSEGGMASLHNNAHGDEGVLSASQLA